MKHALALLAASVCVAGCGDPVSPTGARTPLARPSFNAAPTAQSILARYVALGTSNSMGVQSAGIYAQPVSGPRGRRSLPLASECRSRCRSCGTPAVGHRSCHHSPRDAALAGAFGNDLVTAVMNTCAPLQARRHAAREQRRDLGGRCPRRTLRHYRVTGYYD